MSKVVSIVGLVTALLIIANAVARIDSFQEDNLYQRNLRDYAMIKNLKPPIRPSTTTIAYEDETTTESSESVANSTEVAENSTVITSSTEIISVIELANNLTKEINNSTGNGKESQSCRKFFGSCTSNTDFCCPGLVCANLKPFSNKKYCAINAKLAEEVIATVVSKATKFWYLK